ncbi:E3 ubiquitin-protein ligase UPL4 [Typha angustifolia]|uniref:E3 ubiquitin-protein ligase UPL4 n=1 Tax=Typha angustifolia TaxID=59011 RepID=UPI003C2B1B62
MDRGRKRAEDSGGVRADKRPCVPAIPAAAASSSSEPAGCDTETSSSGRAGDYGSGDSDDGAVDDNPRRPCLAGSGRFQRIIESLEGGGGDAGVAAQVAALTELCEVLSFCGEDFVGYFPMEMAVPALVRLAESEASPDAMLLAVRAVTYICDAMPRSADAVVKHGAVPVLCGKLLAIEYLDVAEQCLQALEKISKKKPLECLQAGAIAAVLTFIDFFSPSIQRVAVSTVANVCKKLPVECSSVVMESVPTLCNLLQYEDQKLVETVAVCLRRIGDSFSSSPQLLDELCQQGVLEKSLHLINIRVSLNQTTCSNLISLLTKLASSSVMAVKTLFELNIGSTLRGILVASDLSHGTPYSLLEDAQFNQVYEVLKLVNQLIPPVARGAEDIQIVLAKERILVDQPNFLHQFSMDILPVSIKAVNTGANICVCYGCLSIMINIFYFTTPDMLVDLLKNTNISSFLSGLLARKDHHLLISTLRIVEILMQKLPDVFLSSFIKEGVVYAIEALLMQGKCSDSMTQQSSDMQHSDNQMAARDVSRCLCYAFTSCKSGSSETRACKLGKDSLFTFSRHIKTTYFNYEAVGSDMVLTEILQKLKTFCAVLNDNVDKSSHQDDLFENEEYLSHILDQVMRELHGVETMTTFEFIESGVVKSLANYLSNGKYLQGSQHDCLPNLFLSVLKRFQTFAHIFLLEMSQGWEKMLLTLFIRKLQNALSSFDNFPIILSHGFKPRNTIADIPVRRCTVCPCIKVCFTREEDEASLSNFGGVVSIEISSSLAAIEEYLWSRISTNMQKQQVEPAAKEIASVSSCAEEPPHETNANVMQEPSTSKLSEGLTNQEQYYLSAEGRPSKRVLISGLPSSGACQVDVRTSAESPSNQGAQPKLTFFLKRKELNRSITLYQAILEDMLNQEPDIILSPNFWDQVHKVTYRSARNSELRDSEMSKAGFRTSPYGYKIEFPWQKVPFFSSLLLAELPCKLDKSNPSYDILFMLKILEGLNRFSFHMLCDEKIKSFAEGKISNFDDLKLTISSVPQAEFISSKLTDKLEQQMRDPLVSNSCCMPSWCSELMTACPFLFSFEARLKYFQMAAFGTLRIQQKHGLQPDSSGTNVITERWSPSMYPRRKFKVDRSNVLEAAAKMMGSHSKSQLEVEYNDEVGTGLGPTMEFYTLASHEFQKAGLGMWRGDLHHKAGTSNVVSDSGLLAAPFGLFPQPWSEATVALDGVDFSEVIKKFALLGQLVAKAIKDGRILDIPFSKAFYKVLLEQELSIYDIQSFDPELGRTLLEFQALVSRRRFLESISRESCKDASDLCYRDARIEDLCIDFTLPGYDDYVLTSESGSNSKMVNIANLGEYISLTVDATTRSGILRQVEAFKSGFNEIFPLKVLQVFTEDELERLLCGEQDTWTFPDLVDHFKFDHGYTASSPPVIHLLEIIQELECDQRRAFLQFVTGAPRLPPGGLAALNPKLTVVRKYSSNEADADLPSVMTCVNYLKLPPYSSKEKMRERLLYAITEGQGSFHLS